MRRPAMAAALLTGLLAGSSLLAGCSGSDIGSSGDQGYVAGKGIITTVAAADRKAPAEVSGTTLDGDRVSLSDFRGQVVVVNVWGSWCPPCRAEAPMLGQAAKDLKSRGVAFLGIDSRDPSQDQARAFVRSKGITYPSLYDPSGRTLLAFHGTLSPSSIPSTLVIDEQGRVAASVLGEITRTTLDDLVDDALKGAGS